MAETYTLEQLIQMGFVPDSVPAQSPPQVGAGETFLNRAVQALPAGNLVTNLLSTGVVQALRPKPGAVIPEAAQAELASMGVQVEQPESVLDTYRDLRNTRRLRTAAGSEQNPNAARAGTATGVVATIAAPWLPKAQVGQGVAGRIASAGLTGGGYGALSGATDGESDLTQGDVGGTLRDTAEGGLWGGLLGLGTAGSVELARPLAGALRRFAVRQGKQTIQGGSDIAAATREPLADEAVEEVLRGGGIQAGSTTQATAGRIEQLARESGEEYARIVAALEARGVRGPDAESIANELLQRGAALEQRTLNAALPRELLDRAEQFSRQGETLQRATGSRNLSLTQAEDFKRSLQEMARYGKLEETPLNAVRREVASVVRQANEDAVEAAGQAAGEGSTLRALADRFRPVKQRTGRLLEAERFAQKGASKAEQRSPVSFKDLLFGSMAGDPVSGMALTTAGSIARNRLPSTLSAGAWGLSEGLRTGSAAGDLAAALAGAAELAGDEAQSRADRATIEPTTDPLTAALIRALRTKPKKDSTKGEK